MTAAAVLEVVVILALAVLIIACAIIGWDRYRPRRERLGQSAHPTDEVFIDPETGRRKRVWFDPTTGARDYRDD